jgi:hypothetical protein
MILYEQAVYITGRILFSSPYFRNMVSLYTTHSAEYFVFFNPAYRQAGLVANQQTCLPVGKFKTTSSDPKNFAL